MNDHDARQSHAFHALHGDPGVERLALVIRWMLGTGLALGLLALDWMAVPR